MAREMGISLGQLAALELTALRKLRDSPELREAYDNFKEDGMPMLEELMASLRQSRADRLLGYQLELLEFWRVYADVRAAGFMAESNEILDEIAGVMG